MKSRHTWWALALGSALHAQSPAPPAAPAEPSPTAETAEPTLHLPKFVTQAELGGVRFYYSQEGKVASAKVERLTKGTKAYRAGLRDGYHLESINGHRVIGLTQPELDEVLKISAEPGQPKTYVFTKRGLLRGKRIELTFHVSERDETPAN